MNETVKRYRKTMKRIGIALLLWMCLFYSLLICAQFGGELIGKSLPPQKAEIVTSVLSAAAYLAAFTLASILYHVIDKQKYDCPFRFTPRLPKNTFTVIFAGVACTFAMSFLNNIAVSMMGFSPAIEIFSYPAEYPSDVYIILQLISVGLVPAFCEELLFRGVVLSNLLPYGKASAIVISSVLFGLMHGNAYQFVYATVAGLIMGSVYVLTDSIWCSILMHMINNTLSILQISLADRFSEEHGNILTMIFFCIMLFVGTLCIFRLVTKKIPEGKDASSEISKLTFSDGISVGDAAKGFLVPSMLVFIIISWFEGIAAAALV